MLKWLKEEVVKQLLAQIRLTAKRYEIIIELLRSQSGVAAEVELLGQRLSTIHGLIFDLTRKVDEFMATQEERLQALAGQVATVQAGVDRIQAEFEAFKANNPQLEDEIAGLEAAIGALVTDVAPPPPTEPPAEG